MILRARLLLPISRPPVEDGAVEIANGRIVRLGRWKDFAADETPIDLGDTILLPGLINAHCHLDYTGMAGMLPPQKSFTDWIKLMLAAKAEWTYTEFAESWVRGAQMLLRTGTTTVVDYEAVPELLPDVWTATPLRVLSLLELTGVKSRRMPREILREALNRMESTPDGRCRTGLAPHAPYSTTLELLRLTAEIAPRENLRVSAHVSESAEEMRMFAEADGPMFQWLRKQRDTGDCGLGSPIQHLERSGILPNLLAAHVNYLGRKDAALLAKRKVNVAHCPRSHAYFRHDKFPFHKLTRAKVNVCLGTDSLATVYKKPKQAIRLSLFDEMREFAAANPRVPARKIVELATINGARALGLAGEIGEISAGALADLIAIPFSGRTSRVCHAVLNHDGDVSASMIEGQWAIDPTKS